MDKYTQAMKEAMASVGNSVILHTLEFRHPQFLDDAGNKIAARIVRDVADLYAPIEAGAPMDAGQWVSFSSVPFDIVPMSEDATANPEVTISVDNISRLLEPYLEIASASTQPVEVTYRPYLSNAIQDGCQMVKPYTMIVSSAISTVSNVTITARMEDILNRAFLWKIVTSDVYPSMGQ